jgi:hypothetical protein
MDFAIKATDLVLTVADYDRHIRSIEAEHGPAEVARVVIEAWESRHRDMSEVDERIQETRDVSTAVGVALDDAVIANLAWHAAARAELGLPD